MRQKLIKKLFSKEMDRKQFLAHVGAGVLTVVGVSGLTKTLVDFTGRQTRESGYGSSAYGGKKTDS
jgi:hypothetical protein